MPLIVLAVLSITLTAIPFILNRRFFSNASEDGISWFVVATPSARTKEQVVLGPCSSPRAAWRCARYYVRRNPLGRTRMVRIDFRSQPERASLRLVNNQL